MSGFSVMSKEPSIIWAGIKEINDRIDAKYFHYDYMTFNLNDYDKVKNLDQCVDFFETGVSNFNEGELRLKRLKTSNIQNNVVLYEDLIDCKIQKKDKRKILQKGDVVLTTYGTGSIGKTAYINSDTQIVPDYTIAILRTKSNLDSGYLMSFFSSSYGNQQVLRRVIGTSGITLVIKPHLKDIKIPIPSQEIQKYIGDKVRRAEELREEAKRLKEEAESLISNSINLERLVEKVRDYKSKNNWVDSASISGRIDGQYYINPITEINKYMKNIDMKLVVLRDIAEVRKGFSYSNESSNGVPYIRISDLDDLLIDYSKVVRIDNKTYQQKRNSQLKYFDLIMAITGATIGKVSVFYNKEIEKATLSADTAYVRFNNIEDSIAYLLYFKTVIGQLAITQGITGATNKHLAIEDIKNIVLPQFEDSIKKEVKNKIVQSMDNIYTSKQLIQEAKQDVEDLIEGNFEMSKLNNDSSTESRC